MSGKAIYFFIVLLVFALFASFNLENHVTVNLGFTEFKDIPLFLFALFSFLIGFLVTLPFFIRGNQTKNNKKRQAEEVQTTSTFDGIQEVELKGEKKGWFQKLKENKKNDDNKSDGKI